LDCGALTPLSFFSFNLDCGALTPPSFFSFNLDSGALTPLSFFFSFFQRCTLPTAIEEKKKAASNRRTPKLRFPRVISPKPPCLS
jgi:hypothetical protein